MKCLFLLTFGALLACLPLSCLARGYPNFIRRFQTSTVRSRFRLAYCYVDPVTLSYKQLPPVILMHGVLDSKLTWHEFASKIAAYTGRRVYYLDARNHGNSPWSDKFNFDVLADDLEYFMDKHRIRRAILVGHSMGGKTAMTLALRRPEIVEKLFVEDMKVSNLSPNETGVVLQLLNGFRQLVASIPQGADEITARKNLVYLMSTNLPPDLIPAPLEDADPETSMMQLPIKKSDTGYSWKTNLDVVERTFAVPGVLDQHLRGYYPKDALFLYGTHSFINVSGDAQQIKKLFPRAQLKAIPGAGHLIHHQHPKAFFSELVTFING